MHRSSAFIRRQRNIASLAQWWQAGTVSILDVQPESDVMIPPESRSRYRDELGERVSIVRIRDAGHALLPEQPEAVARALLDYIRRIFSEK